MKKDLSPLRRNFLIQGLRYTLGGLVLLVIPFLTYARACTLNFSNGAFLVDAQVLIFLLYAICVLNAVLFLAVGPLILVGGLAYVKRAQNLLDLGNPKKVLLDLKLRQIKPSLNGGTLLDGIVTYEDGSVESFKLVSVQNSKNLQNSIAQVSQVSLYGQPKSNPRPRVIETGSGLLLEQPNELGLIQSIFGFSDQEKFLERRTKLRAISLGCVILAYFAFFSPFSFNLSVFPAQSKPILSISIIASIFFLLADLIESLKLVRCKSSLQEINCQFILLKRGILKWLNPKICKVNIVFQDGRKPEQANLLLESYNKINEGEPVYANAYLDMSGSVVGIVNGATSLVKSKVAYWTIAPLVLYLVTVPFCVKLMTPDISKEYSFKSGQDYYQQGVLYKAYGWTEKSRAAMIQAQHFDQKTALKAKTYILTHLPLKPISKDAENLNIKAYNLMAKQKSDLAIEAFKSCISKYPDFEWPNGNLGLLYIKLGDFKQAKYYLDRAIAINPCYVNALHHLAELELRQGHKDQALEYLNRISDIDPNDSQVALQKLAIKTSI